MRKSSKKPTKEKNFNTENAVYKCWYRIKSCGWVFRIKKDAIRGDEYKLKWFRI